MGIDLRILDAGHSEHTGLGRYALEITRALAQVRPDWQIVAFCNRVELFANLSNVELRTTRWPTHSSIGRITWLHLGALRHGARNRPDIWFGPTFVLPAWWSGPSVTTVQDLVFLLMPEHYRGRWNAMHATGATKYSTRKATYVICPSRETRAALERELGLTQDKLRLVPNGVSDVFFSTHGLHTLKSSADVPYLLFVGTFESRKGLDTLFTAVSEVNRDASRVRLVLAGRPGWGTRELIDRMVRGGHTEIVLSPEDDALVELYAGALGVVFPSRMEGFGLPVAEALATGTPVIASRLDSIEEFAGEIPFYIQPGEPNQLRARIEQLLTLRHDLPKRRACRQRAVAHLRWSQVAERTAQVIEEAWLVHP